ncbi:hypothetical protein ACS3UN_07135 [Oscillospiraceae bacterium LTW-04]|nr:hypothetical protein RBH76_03225 [Oscillospiraceae bacterium MB24-C1]
MNFRTRGYKLTRENYADVSNKSTLGKNLIYIKALEDKDENLIKCYSEVYADYEGLVYKDDWCKTHLAKVMQNYDLNIEFFGKLDHEEFEREITNFLHRSPFFEITDLTNYSCPGYYIMILDKFCQLYIGTTQDILKRIKQHWYGGKMRFDRLIFGQVTNSKLSIDSFRALDTTRILIYPTSNIYSHENKYIDFFSNKFVCNRTSGGIMEFGTLSVLSNLKTRDL